MQNKNLLKQELDQSFAQKLLQGKIPVFGEGNVNSKIVFIGEAPGGDEEKQGRPFVGKAGKNLSEFLDEINVDRSSIYITNAVKFRPTKENPTTHRLSNRTPTTQEILLFREWLIKELELIKPELVVTLGNTPLFSVTGDNSIKITAVHGQTFEHKLSENTQFTLMPFYHPAAVIYRRELAEIYREDMKKFKNFASNLLNE